MDKEEKFYKECAKKTNRLIDEAFDSCQSFAEENDLNLEWVLDYFVNHCRRRFDKNLKEL